MVALERTRTQSKLLAWREALLDGSRTNQLLYFKGDNVRGSAAIRLFGDSQALFRRLLAEQKSQTEPITQAMLGIAPLEADASAETKKAHQTQIDLIFKRLKKLRDKARDAQSNRGVTILYAACGVLQWRESEESEEIIRSPLVLVPIDLQSKGTWSDEYLVARQAESRIVVNPTLREKLKRDFGIELPELTEDGKFHVDDKLSVSFDEVIGRMQDALTQNTFAKNWTVASEMYLGLFTFQRQSLYDDLINNEELVMVHEIIRALSGEGALPPPKSPPIPAEQLDAQLRPQDTWQVLDADASQQEAIVAAKRGQSFVLQGPPGTGKSQTIANIIAECIAAGKHILFVSEKMAAIEVVQKRLTDVGLGPFCLNLHHRGADSGEKARVYDALRHALDTQASPSGFQERQWEDNVAQMTRTREYLNTYVHELHAIQRSSLRLTAFSVYGKLALHAETPDIHCSIPQPDQVTTNRFAEMQNSLERLSDYCDLLVMHHTHPWQQTLLRQYDPTVQAKVRATYESLLSYLDMTMAKSARLSELLGRSPSGGHETDTTAALDLAAFALTTPQPLPHWLQPQQPEALRSLSATAAQQHHLLATAQEALSRHYQESVLASDFPRYQELANALEASPARFTRIGFDTFLADQSQWHAQLAEMVRVLPALQVAAEAIAKLCELPEPATLGECGALAHLAELMAQTPCPPMTWFEQSTRHAARKEALALAKAYRQSSENRQQLRATYSDAFFALDLVGLQERFARDYGSLLRFVRPAWYQDRKQLQGTLQPEVPLPTYTTLARDVALAAATLALEARLAADADDHRERLGGIFAGGATDWSALQAQIAWVEALCTLAQEWDWELTPAIRALAAKPKRRWAEFEAQQQHLCMLWEQWETLAAWLHPKLDGSALVATPALTDAAPLALLPQVEALQAALEPVWAMAQMLKEHRKPNAAVSWQSLQQAIAAGVQLQQAQRWLTDQHVQLSTAFAGWYAGAATDWAKLRAALDWCQTAIERFEGNQPPAAFVTLVGQSTDEALANVRTVEQLHRDLTAHLASMTGLWQDADTILPRTLFLAAEGMALTPHTLLRQRIGFQLEALPLLERWVRFLNERERCEALGLASFLAALTQLLDTNRLPWQDHAERKTAWLVFEKCFFQAWLTEFTQDVPILKEFRGTEHERMILQFQDADKKFLKHSQRRLVEAQRFQRRTLQHQLTLAAMQPPSQRDESATMLLEMKRQASLKRRKSLRKLIEIAGASMRDLMPCWMMSPMSVSEYIDPRKMVFDLVIFDEASQICAEDAISSIIRGRQLIVVGDEKQMPPTNVFRKALVLEDEDDESDEAQDTQRAESILKECAAVMLPRMLRFHYRSQHESLIAFSNAHFYDNQLVTFPSARAEHRDGLEFVHLSDGVYDRGGSRTNHREAEYVADLVMRFAEQQPDQKVGVVAFSVAQQTAIDDELIRRRKLRPELEPFFGESNEDAFFIRNLESVQGDERDVIILSVGYGRDKTGKLTQAFGPLNSGGGERRLNVAITRARQKMIVVSSIRSGDITGTSVGARALRGYLDFAEHGKQALTLATKAVDEQFDSPFEKEVCRALQARGLSIDTQVGCSGYRIDMAVRDPANPDRYILGIECDGASYHSAKTARDRDRLRQAQLESLGWQIHRIWSRDWFNHPQHEIIKVLKHLEESHTI